MAEPENPIGLPDSIVGGATGVAYERVAQHNLSGHVVPFSPPPTPANDGRDPTTPVHNNFIEAAGLRQITPDGLKASLSASQVQYIETLKKSWFNYFSIWCSAYPDLASESDTTRRAQIKGKVDAAVSGVEAELNKISTFLQDCGIEPQNHFIELQRLVKALRNGRN